MASAMNGIVVWEFREHDYWTPYEPHVTQFIEQSYVNIRNQMLASRANGVSCADGVLLDLGYVDSKLKYYYVDLSDISTMTGKYQDGFVSIKVPIQRRICPEDCTLAKGVLWQWKHNLWTMYDMETAEILEKEYKKHPRPSGFDLSCTSNSLPYYIDFIQMTQTNVHTNFQRNIRRYNVSASYPKYNVSGKNSQTEALSSVSVTQASRGTVMRKKTGGALSGQTQAALKSQKFQQLHQAQAGLMVGGASSTHMHTAGQLSSSMHTRSSCNSTGYIPSLLSTSFVPQNTRRTKNAAGLARVQRPYERKMKPTSKCQHMQSAIHDLTTQNDCNIHKMLRTYSKLLEKIPPEEDCCICCDKLIAASSYTESDHSTTVIELNKCKHMFHQACLLAMYSTGVKNCSMQCPVCKTIYGEMMGCCPDGSMKTYKMSQSLPGHPGCGAIVIEYDFPSGIQDDRHPHPGHHYYAKGFPRQCFLPDNKDGQKILELLEKAWFRRLTFTIGTSVSTGHPDTIIWNDIHHKTEYASNVAGHGYPDPNYVDNVLAELAAQGITESDKDSGDGQNVSHLFDF